MDFYFESIVTYSQVAIYNKSASLFNSWDDEHVAQGFAWREGNVAFGIPDFNGELLVRIIYSDDITVCNQIDRIIEVPFYADGTGVEFGTIFDDWNLELKKGSYQIKFTLCMNYKYEGKRFEYFALFQFFENNLPQFKINKKGGEMTTDKVLKTTASVES